MKRLTCLIALIILLTTSVIATSCKPQAQFEIVSLDVHPSEVIAGQQANATVKVRNTGTSEGSYTAILKIDGVEIGRKTIRISPNVVETVTFSLFKDSPGIYNLEIGGFSRSFAVKAPLAKAEFEVLSISIFPPQAIGGETVTIVAKVRNMSTIEGIYTAVLTINGVRIQVKRIPVTPGAVEPVTFLMATGLAGTYEIGVGELKSRLEVNEKPVTKDRVVLENVPILIQRGLLDCGYTSRAMLLKYHDNRISYEQSVYDSGASHGLVYKPGDLSFRDLGFVGWHKDFYWLAALYGVTFVPTRIAVQQEALYGRQVFQATVIARDEEEAWNEYIDRISYYLEKGVPVQTSKSWKPFPLGPWWSGIPEEHRAGNHWMVIVGVDRTKGVVYIHSPWPTIGKIQMKLEDFRKSIEANQFPYLKYVIHVFLKAPLYGIEEKEKAVRERNHKRLRGEPDVYYLELRVAQGYVFGLRALQAFKQDLSLENFGRIIREKERRGITAAETTTWISLFMYQHSFLSKLGAEYLKSTGRESQEQKLLDTLHKSYDELHIYSEKLGSVFKSSKNTTEALTQCEPILEGMRMVITEMIKAVHDYIRANP